MRVIEREGIVLVGNGTKLHYRCHRLEDIPFRAVVAFFQPPQDDEGLHAELVRRLIPSGYVVYGCAHHQRRKAPGQMGFLEEWSELATELDAYVTLVQAHEPDAAIFLAGGLAVGDLTMTYALHHPEKLSGILDFHAPFASSSNPGSLLVSFTHALSRVWPAFAPMFGYAGTSEPGAPETRVNLEHSDTDHQSPRDVQAGPESDVTIPVLSIGEESSDTEGGGGGHRHGTSRPHRTMDDVVLWLDRVLSNGAD